MVQVLRMQVIIIGGGAAGLMAMATILELNPTTQVTLIERNDGLGKKVIISGGGRCNVTTGLLDVKTVLTKYPRGNKFLSSAMHKFPPQAVVDWFEGHGVPLKTEPDLRVFPRSDNGHDVVNVFEELFQAHHTTVLLKAPVIRVEKQGEHFAIHLKTQPEPLVADKLILTTGGQAYRQTGSTGDGYAFAQSLGHNIAALAPSLNAFHTQETWPAEVAGLSFEWAELSARTKTNQHFTGPFLFTHKGVSGPAVFALSSLVAFETYSPTTPLMVNIDLFPNQTVTELTLQLETTMSASPKKDFGNVLASLVPKSLVTVLCRELKQPAHKHASEVSKKERTTAVAWLKGIPLNVVGRGAGDEFVTAGGVSLLEVNPSTMESRVCPGLYFA
ncbi:MAG: aminoacetone oxidase family FAD-binding enzyme, partial [Candidatus Veblenbacteria bacterium]|nr:aminoacetone oxidase family FAD-binding enzyme [Candidatus Veblenbacteria bacterium]